MVSIPPISARRTSKFKMKSCIHSEILENNGFYAVFYIEKIRSAKQLSYGEVRLSIKKDLFDNQKEEIVMDNVAKLEDAILSAENLKEIANEFTLW